MNIQYEKNYWVKEEVNFFSRYLNGWGIFGVGSNVVLRKSFVVDFLMGFLGLWWFFGMIFQLFVGFLVDFLWKLAWILRNYFATLIGQQIPDFQWNLWNCTSLGPGRIQVSGFVVAIEIWDHKNHHSYPLVIRKTSLI